jgi:alpha-galactosidase
MLRLTSAALALAALPLAHALGNGLARTPQMGWNPYNAFNVYTTEAQYHQQADLLVSTGLAALGYNYFVLYERPIPHSRRRQADVSTGRRDSGWQAKSRASNGSFQWDTSRLPAGVPALSSYVHNKGLKFGLYSDGYVYRLPCTLLR